MTARIAPMVLADAARVGRMHHQAWVDSYGAFLPADYFQTRWTLPEAVQLWRGLLREPPEPGVVRLVADSTPVAGASAPTAVDGFVVVGPARQVDGRPPPRCGGTRGPAAARRRRAA